MLWHCERLRQSREAECPEAHAKGHSLPGDVLSSWTVMRYTTTAIWEGTPIHLPYVCGCQQHYGSERPALMCQKGRNSVHSATTMQRLSLRAPPLRQLPGSNLVVLSACSSHSARPCQVWMDRWWRQARHSLDAAATSTRSCRGIVGLQVCPSCKLSTCTCMANGLACT